MKILCLTTNLDRPSIKYRLLLWKPYLKSAGIETEIIVLPGRFKRWQIFRRADKYEGVFIQKKLFSRIEQRYLRKKAKKIIYDFDDAVMYTKKKYSNNTRRYKRFRYMVNIADIVIAGNKYLAEIADVKNKIFIIPTVMDVTKYPLHERKGGDIILGWIGTKSTQIYLDIILPVLKKTILKYPDVKVKIVSNEDPEIHDKNIIWEKWDKDTEVEQLLSFDIGLMPLAEDQWTKGKCGLKITQYLAVGIPVVCSPVGVNKELVKDGINGYTASNIDEWGKGLSRIIEDSDLYKRMCIASRDIAEKNFNLVYWGPYLADIIGEKIC